MRCVRVWCWVVRVRVGRPPCERVKNKKHPWAGTSAWLVRRLKSEVASRQAGSKVSDVSLWPQLIPSFLWVREKILSCCLITEAFVSPFSDAPPTLYQRQSLVHTTTLCFPDILFQSEYSLSVWEPRGTAASAMPPCFAVPLGSLSLHLANKCFA